MLMWRGLYKNVMLSQIDKGLLSQSHRLVDSPIEIHNAFMSTFLQKIIFDVNKSSNNFHNFMIDYEKDKYVGVID